MTNEEMILFDGNEFSEYEGTLVGNKAGLEKLKTLINQAINKGKSEKGIGEYYAGVICIQNEDNPFKKVKKSTLLSTIIISIIGLIVTTSIPIGLTSMIKWIISVL